MTRLPIDGTALTFISTGKYRPVSEYGELSDGSRRPTGRQASIDGVPLWTVDVLLDDDDSDRAEAVGVKVASHEEPKLPKFQAVQFVGLTCTPYVDRRTNRIALSFSASGIANAGAGSTSRSKAAVSAGE